MEDTNVFAKLASIQTELIAPKGQFNSFGKYSYRSCEDILKALKPLCASKNCLVYIDNDLVHIGDFNYVEATVHFVDLESGRELTSTAHAREEETKKGMDGSQITGASSSYARKYALAGMFCIDNEKDSDATNKGEEPKQEDAVKEAEYRARVLKFINNNEDPKAVLDYIKNRYKADAKELTKDQALDFIKLMIQKGKII